MRNIMWNIMRTKRALPLLLCVVSLFLAGTCAFGQDISTEQRTRQLEDKEKELRKTIEKKREAPEIKKELPAPPAALESQEKTLIKTINVTGVTFLPQETIREIIAGFQGKELTLKEMQVCADLITAAYRKEGFITSRAYLPPQKVEAAVLEVRVVEGLMGTLTVTGNRYFKTRLFERRFSLKKGDGFDYDKLRADMARINQYPDRSARSSSPARKRARPT